MVIWLLIICFSKNTSNYLEWRCIFNKLSYLDVQPAEPGIGLLSQSLLFVFDTFFVCSVWFFNNICLFLSPLPLSTLRSQTVQQNCYSQVIILFVRLHSAVNPLGIPLYSLLTLLQSGFGCQSQNTAEGEKRSRHKDKGIKTPEHRNLGKKIPERK